MADAYTIINMALQKLGISGAAKSPRPEDLAIGLTSLQSLYRQLITSGSLGRARPVIPTSDYVARENDRILRTSAMVGSITLPQTVTADDCGEYPGYIYDLAICSEPRPPRDGSFVIINDSVTGNTAEYLYEAYINQWISLHDLSLQQYQEVTDANGNVVEVIQPSIAPLSYRDANGLAALLATKMVDYYGASLNPATINDARSWETTLATRIGEPEESVYNELMEGFTSRRY